MCGFTAEKLGESKDSVSVKGDWAGRSHSVEIYLKFFVRVA